MIFYPSQPVQDMDLDINAIVSGIVGTASAVAGSTMGSVMDMVENIVAKFHSGMKMSLEEVVKWRPKNKKSTIVIIVIRITPKTKDYNNGIAQIIACVIGVYLLNIWGLVSGGGQNYEIFPQVISLGGTRQEPADNPGVDDLYRAITSHEAFTNHNVVVLAKTTVRFAEDPHKLDSIVNSAKHLVTERNKRDPSKEILSIDFKALECWFCDINRWSELEHNCAKRISALDGSHKDVAIGYEEKVSPDDQMKQEQTNVEAAKMNNDLESSSAGDTLRQLVTEGYIPPKSNVLPDFGLLTMLNNSRHELSKGKADRERVVRDIIKNVRNIAQQQEFKLPPALAKAKALSFSRRSPTRSVSFSIGNSSRAEMSMNGAQHLPRHQITTNVAALGVHGVKDDIIFMHAEGVLRDIKCFNEWHEKLLAFLIVSNMKPIVVVTTLVRLGADLTIVETILEFIRQLGLTLVTADCIGYDANLLAETEAGRKLQTRIERSKLIEDKEDEIAKLKKDELKQHFALATVEKMRVGKYPRAKELVARVAAGTSFAVSERRALLEGDGDEDGHSDDDRGGDEGGHSDDDRKMPAV